MIEIDGSSGEGGGQIVRSSLALSMVTGEPIRISRIRAGRARPGLMRQHLTAVHAAAEVSAASVSGDALGSSELVFRPRTPRAGTYRFSVGTAGSTSLVLQTILPALALASGESRLTLSGGTHNPKAPPFEFLAKTFLPLLARMGPRVEATLERYGFYPAGGGRIQVSVTPATRLARIDLLERGPVRGTRVDVLLSALPRHIAAREVGVVLERLSWDRSQGFIHVLEPGVGPGNVVSVEIASDALTETFTGFGERGVPAERVAAGVAEEVSRYLAAGVPVGAHLADQLLLPMAISGGGSIRTLEPTLHTRTQIDLVGRFLGVRIHHEREGDRSWRVGVDS